MNDEENTSDLTEGLDLAFDGAEDILRAWRRGMRPDPDLTVSEWANKHRKLSSRASAEPGQYRTARTPYLRAIMDALSPGHPAQRISFMKAAQVGATEDATDAFGLKARAVGRVFHGLPRDVLACVVELVFDNDQATFLVQSQKIEALLRVGKPREFLLDDQQVLTKTGWILGDPLLQVSDVSTRGTDLRI